MTDEEIEVTAPLTTWAFAASDDESRRCYAFEMAVNDLALPFEKSIEAAAQIVNWIKDGAVPVKLKAVK